MTGKSAHSDNPIHIERRYEQDAIIQFRDRTETLLTAIKKARGQLKRGNPARALETLESAIRTDRDRELPDDT